MVNKLNKKLAEWRFPDKQIQVCDTGIWVIGTDKEFEIEGLLTESLNACFKWLAPKLGHCELHKWGDDAETFLAKVYLKHCMRRVEDKNPALALCLAISKLIDSENKDATR